MSSKRASPPRAGLRMTAGRRRGLCAPGPRLPGTALSVADSAVDAAAAAALRARIAAAFDTFRARVCRRRRVCTCAGIPSDRKAFASRHNGVSCACEAARLPPAMKPPCAPARAGGRVSSHRKSVRPAAEQAAAMITAVKVAVLRDGRLCFLRFRGGAMLSPR